MIWISLAGLAGIAIISTIASQLMPHTPPNTGTDYSHLKNDDTAPEQPDEEGFYDAKGGAQKNRSTRRRFMGK